MTIFEKNAQLTKEEFCERFKAYMLSIVGETDINGDSVADYADEVAPTYWAEERQRRDGPEECAQADLEEWETDAPPTSGRSYLSAASTLGKDQVQSEAGRKVEPPDLRIREAIAATILWEMEETPDVLIAGLKERNAPLWTRAMQAAAALQGLVNIVEPPRFSQIEKAKDWLRLHGNARHDTDTWLTTNHRLYINYHVVAPIIAALALAGEAPAGAETEGFGPKDESPKGAQNPSEGGEK